MRDADETVKALGKKRYMDYLEGINRNVKYLCTKRRSKGGEVCEVILKLRE